MEKEILYVLLYIDKRNFIIIRERFRNVLSKANPSQNKCVTLVYIEQMSLWS